jgi:ATP-dependent protease ClpP protease subunit
LPFVLSYVAAGHIWIYGIIGTAPKGTSDKYYSFVDFQKDLSENPNADEYVVHIISPGGDVFQGQAIYNGLINTKKKITVQIEGVCASIATLISQAADPGELIMNESAQFMIHNPKFDAISGDANQLRTGAEQLDQIKTLLITAYKKRTGLPDDQLSEMSNKETWMLPQQAKELGFVDEVVQSHKAVAFADYKFLDDMENNTRLNAIESTLKKIVAFFKPKNLSDTLADGTVIQVDAEDGEWVGKSVMKEDGTPLEPGEYPLSDGRVLVIGDGSTIAEVKEAVTDVAKPEETPENDDMKYKEENETLKARIAELESAIEARNEVAEQAEARAKSAVNLAQEVKAELEKIKTTTAGDATPPKMATKQPVNNGQVTDPMALWFKQNILDKRNTD